MKFGKYFLFRKKDFPSEWSNKYIEYVELKLFIKRSILPKSLRFEPVDLENAFGETARMSAMILSRGKQVLDQSAVFFDQLEDQLNAFSAFYNQQESALLSRFTSPENDPQSRGKLLDDIVVLESFVLLNYTGVTKILKKFEKASGLGAASFADAMIHKLTRTTNFYYEKKLRAVKQELLSELKTNVPGSPPKALQRVDPRDVGRAQNDFPLSGARMNSEESNCPDAGEQNESIGNSHGVLRAPSYDVLAAIINSDANGSMSSTTALLQEGKSLETLFPAAAMLPNPRILITMSGAHGTDIKQALLRVLGESQCTIEDTSFSRLYHLVTYAVLVRLDTSSVEYGLFRKLRENARKWNATLQFDAYGENDVLPASLTDAPYPNRVKYYATILNQDGLSAKFLSDFTALLLRYRISVEKLRRLNFGRVMCSADYQLSVPKETNIDEFRQEIFQLTSEHSTDIALQEATVFRRSKRLVVFDMDSTLIQQEVVDEIAKYAGVVDQVASITHRAMMGELDFTSSLRERVGLLKGLPIKTIEQVKHNLTFTPGAHTLCRCLKRLGYKLAVISGGFIPLANHVKSELGLDYAFANSLKVTIDGSALTGEVQGPIVTGERKAELLEVIAQAENIVLDQAVAIGDGANDLHMLGQAGLGIAFNAKPRVQEKARNRINQKSLASVLYLLGHTDEDVRELIAS